MSSLSVSELAELAPDQILSSNLEAAPPEGNIEDIIKIGPRSIYQNTLDLDFQAERLARYAFDIGGLLISEDWIYIGYYISVRLKGSQSLPFNLLYEIPVSAIHSGKPTVEKFSSVVVSNFIQNHQYDLDSYEFQLGVKKSDIGTNKFFGASKPGNLRILNLTIAAVIMDQYLISKGYRRILIQRPAKNEILKDDDYLWRYQEPETSEKKILKELKTMVVSETQIENSAEFYTREVTGDTGINPAPISDIFKPVTISELRQKLNSQENLLKIKKNVRDYLIWKKAKYETRLKDLAFVLDREKRLFKIAELTEKEQEGFSTSLSTKIGRAYLTGAIECLSGKINEVETINLFQLQKDYLSALEDISGINEEAIQNKIATLISSLILGYQGFSNDFQNIVITGPAGVGKTTLAFILASAFKKLHILCLGNVQVVTRSELVATYLGQTANKTRSILYSSLEGILFIDEAYQVGGCPKEDSYGMESLTEIVNFLDKWIGITMVLVAGYESQMQTCFFDRNEGLRRRFPVKYSLPRYKPTTLFKVLMASIFRNMNIDFFDRKLFLPKVVYQFLIKFNERDLFPNAGGDMQILGGKIVRYYLASENVGQALINAFYEFGLVSGEIDESTLTDLLLSTVKESVSDLGVDNFTSEELSGLHYSD